MNYKIGDVVVLISGRSNITNDVPDGIANGTLQVGNKYKIISTEQASSYSNGYMICLRGNNRVWWVGIDVVSKFASKSRFPSWL